MKRALTPLFCLVALVGFALPTFAATPELPTAASVESAPDALQSVDGCDRPVIDPELAEFGLTPEPTLAARLCGACSIYDCRGYGVGQACTSHAETPVPGTCQPITADRCFDGSYICACS